MMNISSLPSHHQRKRVQIGVGALAIVFSLGVATPASAALMLGADERLRSEIWSPAMAVGDTCTADASGQATFCFGKAESEVWLEVEVLQKYQDWPQYFIHRSDDYQDHTNRFATEGNTYIHLRERGWYLTMSGSWKERNVIRIVNIWSQCRYVPTIQCS